MRCGKKECFRNGKGSCKLLTGKPKEPECPFFKTMEEAEKGYRTAAERLEEIGNPEMLAEAMKWVLNMDIIEMKETGVIG